MRDRFNKTSYKRYLSRMSNARYGQESFQLHMTQSSVDLESVLAKELSSRVIPPSSSISRYWEVVLVL